MLWGFLFVWSSVSRSECRAGSHEVDPVQLIIAHYHSPGSPLRGRPRGSKMTSVRLWGTCVERGSQSGCWAGSHRVDPASLIVANLHSPGSPLRGRPCGSILTPAALWGFLFTIIFEQTTSIGYLKFIPAISSIPFCSNGYQKTTARRSILRT